VVLQQFTIVVHSIHVYPTCQLSDHDDRKNLLILLEIALSVRFQSLCSFELCAERAAAKLIKSQVLAAR
jgi:hypothetical protein